MVTGITQAEMNEEFSNKDFTLDNFILFVQEIDPSFDTITGQLYFQ